jgi:hypothetical protein
MSKLMQVKIGDATILMETSDIGTRGVIQAGLEEKIVENFEKMFEAIKPLCESIVKTIESLGKQKPNQAQVEFGITLNGEGNLYIVKLSGEASIKVTLSWTLH